MRNKNQMVVSIALLAAVLSITIGFAAFTSTLTISSRASITPDASTFSVKFSKVSGSIQDGASYPVAPISGSGDSAIITNTANPTIEGLKANFTNVGESVVYEFYALNDGEFDAYLTDIKFLNIDGKNVSKYCTPGEGATASLVDAACKGIDIKVNIDGFGDANTTREVKGHKLLKDTSEKVTVTISYESGYVDGNISVDFGDIQLTYSTVDNETGDVSGGMADTNEDSLVQIYFLNAMTLHVDNNTGIEAYDWTIYIDGEYADTVFLEGSELDIGYALSNSSYGHAPGTHELYVELNHPEYESIKSNVLTYSTEELYEITLSLDDTILNVTPDYSSKGDFYSWYHLYIDGNEVTDVPNGEDIGSYLPTDPGTHEIYVTLSNYGMETPLKSNTVTYTVN